MSPLEISDADKQDLITMYKERLSKIEAERKRVISMLEKLTGEKVITDKQEEQEIKKEAKFTWKGLTILILKEQNELMTTDDIYERAIEKQPSLRNQKKRKVLSGLSGGLSQHKRNGEVDTLENPYGKGNFWGIKSWFENGYINSLLNKLGEKGYDPDLFDLSSINENAGFQMERSVIEPKPSLSSLKSKTTTKIPKLGSSEEYNVESRDDDLPF